ncbi:MAG: hypothetical protein ACMUIM_00270 [bacterium]
MAGCHDMKKGEIYMCEDCGMELQVIKECKDVGKPAADCSCHSEEESCTIECCGNPLVKKGS